MKESFKPISFKPIPIPYRIENQIVFEIDRRVKERKLKPVNYGTPTVPVKKKTEHLWGL